MASGLRHIAQPYSFVMLGLTVMLTAPTPATAGPPYLSDDPEPTDLGEDEGTEGNCVISMTGKGPDKKSKISIFGNSLEQCGFKAAYLNGYAPNLIGLRAEFFQEPQQKGSNYKGKGDPTALVVKSIAVMPSNQGGKAGGGAAGAAGRTTAPKPAAQAGKAAAAATSTPAPVAAQTQAADGDDDVASTAVNMLMKVGETRGGQTLTRQKISAALIVLMPKNRVPQTMHKPIQELVKNDDWFKETAETLGWEVTETGETTIPKAE